MTAPIDRLYMVLSALPRDMRGEVLDAISECSAADIARALVQFGRLPDNDEARDHDYRRQRWGIAGEHSNARAVLETDAGPCIVAPLLATTKRHDVTGLAVGNGTAVWLVTDADRDDAWALAAARGQR